MAVGLALLVSALVSPRQSLATDVIPGTPEWYFFLPVGITVTVGSFNGTAVLQISQLDPNLNVVNSIVNITVYPKESVEFSAPSRGFYQIELTQGPQLSKGIPVVIDETGVPLDLLTSGIALVITACLPLVFTTRWFQDIVGRRRKVPIK
jgi:hypothetical protein